MTDHSMRDLKEEALNELKGYINSGDYTEDTIFEIADSSVPIMNWDLLEYAQDDLWLSCTEPEILAFGGEPTAVSCIAGNIYQEISEYLHDNIDALLEEQELD